MEEFEIINRYRRLMNRDAAPALLCTCGHDFTVRLGEGDKPTLKCYTCGVTQTVGVKMLMSMEHAIKIYERRRV